MANRSRWRNSAESSKPSLASAASNPSSVSASGLTSSMVASVATNSLYKRLICSAAAFLSVVTSNPSTAFIASSSRIPARMSTGIRMIFSGDVAARSSIDVPPSAHAIIIGPAVFRSKTIEKYVSRFRFIFSAINNVFTGRPVGPVCFVTRVPPSIFPATSTALSFGTRCTPPWNPLLKVPRPLPPARICDFTTTSSPASWLVAAATWSRLVTGIPRGTLMPYEAISSAPWYS